jgi:predicted regulator of Ras-like GTPase activity (Roadblock/LC7/MglB family)
MSDFILFERDLERLSDILTRYINDAQLMCALLTNKEGQLLNSQGSTDTIDTTSVAALVTGSFAATVSIAGFIGETEFTTMLHRGKNRHIHILLIDSDRYLASVFDNRTTAEKVGHFAQVYGRELRDYLVSMANNADSAWLPDLTAEEPGTPAAAAPPPSPADSWQPAGVLFNEEKAPTAPQPMSAPVAIPVHGSAAPEQIPMAAAPMDIPTPPNTAYLRIKILEAQASIRKKRKRGSIFRKMHA